MAYIFLSGAAYALRVDWEFGIGADSGEVGGGLSTAQQTCGSNFEGLKIDFGNFNLLLIVS